MARYHQSARAVCANHQPALISCLAFRRPARRIGYQSQTGAGARFRFGGARVSDLAETQSGGECSLALLLRFPCAAQ